jgi:hypothetical protein
LSAGPWQAGSWSIEASIEYYFANMAAMLEAHATQAASQEGLAELFNRYKDEHADMILADGVGRFCEDLQVHQGYLVPLTPADHALICR